MKELQLMLYSYYFYLSVYYDQDIVESESLWNDKSHLCYNFIIEQVKQSSQMLELGCGKSSILKWFSAFQDKYTGIEFSESLIVDNTATYPEATFL